MAEVTVHNMPSVFVMETEMPLSMVTDINDYLDEYKETEDKKSLADTLVGQITQGEQLLLDNTDKRIKEYSDFICSLGADYINFFSQNTGTQLNHPKAVAVDETWSVHSYAGDYNPIHDHGTKTIMGISTTGWTKVPQQILEQPTAGSQNYSLYQASGDCDGYIAFQYGRNELMNTERLRPPQSFVIKPEVGKLLVFPSWLQHMVYPFKGEGERRTIASNLNCWDMPINPEVVNAETHDE
ncbi:MAG: putative 2OG-Fe(II) oxygenase [Cyanophyceae cyanobacterium]